LNHYSLLYRENVVLARKVWPMGLHLSYPLAGLSVLLNSTERPAEAEELLRECFDIQQRALPAGQWHVTCTQALLGRTLALQGRLAEAEKMLVETCGALETNSSVPPHRKRIAFQFLIELYNLSGQAEKAAEYEQRLAAAMGQ
jgi:hypothetical protein